VTDVRVYNSVRPVHGRSDAGNRADDTRFEAVREAVENYPARSDLAVESPKIIVIGQSNLRGSFAPFRSCRNVHPG